MRTRKLAPVVMSNASDQRRWIGYAFGDVRLTVPAARKVARATLPDLDPVAIEAALSTGITLNAQGITVAKRLGRSEAGYWAHFDEMAATHKAERAALKQLTAQTKAIEELFASLR